MTGKLVDLTGRVFGAWTVVGLVERDEDSPPYRQWNCRCEGCGQVLVRRGTSLLDGGSLSHKGCKGKSGEKVMNTKKFGIVWHQQWTREFSPRACRLMGSLGEERRVETDWGYVNLILPEEDSPNNNLAWIQVGMFAGVRLGRDTSTLDMALVALTGSRKLPNTAAWKWESMELSCTVPLSCEDTQSAIRYLGLDTRGLVVGEDTGHSSVLTMYVGTESLAELGRFGSEKNDFWRANRLDDEVARMIFRGLLATYADRAEAAVAQDVEDVIGKRITAYRAAAYALKGVDDNLRAAVLKELKRARQQEAGGTQEAVQKARILVGALKDQQLI